MKLYVILAIASLAVSFATVAVAQENELSLTQQDREQILAIGKKNDDAWSKSDAAALAALYTEDAFLSRPRQRS